MSVPNRQIGWSNESNLLWNISKQLEKLNGVVAATAAGGMLNPTTNYIPFNSGLAFGDSYLVNDTTASVLKTVYSGNDVGLKLDFASFNYYLGDFNGFQNSAYIYCNNDTSPGVYAYSEGSSSMAIGFHTANLGDWSFAQNGTIFNVNDSNQIIKTQYQGVDVGLKLDFANGIYTFGDFNTNPTGNFISIDYTGLISTQNVSNGIEGIVLDMANRNYLLGDPGNVNGTRLVIDDANQRLEVSGNLSANTAGASASKYLKIRVGGVDYKIALLNN